MAESFRFDPSWIKDPWVELTALLPDDEREKLVPIILQLSNDILQAQLKAVGAAQKLLAGR